MANGQSGADGRFALRVPRRGRYLLRVAHADFADTPNRVGLLARDDVDTDVGTVVLDSGLMLSGRVVDDAGGRAVGGVEVVLQASLRDERLDHGLAPRRARSGSDGSFAFVGLPARRYTLDVRAERPYAAQRVHGLRARLPGDEAVVLRLQRGVVASVRVEDADGKAQAGAQIELRPTGRSRAVVQRARTDARGSCEVEGLTRGAWELRAAFGLLEAQLRVRAPTPEALVVRLPRARSLELRHRAVGTRAAARWRALWPDARVRSAWRDAVVPREGVLRVDGLPPEGPASDPLLVELRVPGSAPVILPLAELRSGALVPARAAAELRVRFAATGAETSPRGRTLELRYRSLSAPPERGVVGEDGELSLRPLHAAEAALYLDGEPLGAPLALEAGRSRVVTLPWPPPRGALTVMTPASLAPGARLHVWAVDGTFRDLRNIRASARISFPDLAAGKYGLRIRAPAGRASPDGELVFVEVLHGQSVPIDLR